jgi:hypothetical protein
MSTPLSRPVARCVGLATAAAFALLLTAPMAAQSPATPPSTAPAAAAAPPPPPCSAAEYRELDVWAGSWDVTLASGAPAGHNEIEPILGGCVLREHWRGAGGLEGYSFNSWDARSRKWHQTWVDSAGSMLQLSGGRRGEAMVLEGEQPANERAPMGVRHRITWTPLAEGAVRQHWETSTDGGTTWSSAFDGTYRPAARAAAPPSSEQPATGAAASGS